MENLSRKFRNAINLQILIFVLSSRVVFIDLFRFGNCLNLGFLGQETSTSKFKYMYDSGRIETGKRFSKFVIYVVISGCMILIVI
jgi:hypothetical protein